MYKSVLSLVIFCLCFLKLSAQTTDLAVVVEAQNLSGTDVSQVQIYQEFQYIVTIINSGNAVSNATFSLNLNDDVVVNSYVSQNNLGGASDAENFNLDLNNVLTGSVASLPNNSSVEIRINVNAPTDIGGIAFDALVSPPSGTTDTNTSNNQSIISIDVIDIPIDFSVVYSQISPAEGTGITAWNDTVTYEFTITNNSSVSYPLYGMTGFMTLQSPFEYGQPVVQLQSIECVGSTNGTECPDLSTVNGPLSVVNTTSAIFSYGTPHVFTSGGSITFQVVYQFLQPSCAFDPQQIIVDSYINIELNHVNESSDSSNLVQTNLLTAELCNVTDICIDTIQTNPDVSTVVDWGEEVTFETTVCNNGPLDAPIVFFLQNLSTTVTWDIISITCLGTTGDVTCDDFTITDMDTLWASDTFTMPVGATITIETTVIFLEPECSTSTQNTLAHVRSGTNIMQSQLFDSNIENSAQSDFVTLPPTASCPASDIQVIKTQIAPELPEGGDVNNTTDWGPITYEITVTNAGDVDTFIELSDYMTLVGSIPVSASLLSVECVSTTGTAECFTITNANIDVVFDGEPEDGEFDEFWGITVEDNWGLPAQSSVTFQATVNWQPGCSSAAIPVINNVTVNHIGDDIIDASPSNNSSQVTSYLAPCVDLIVQTFPEFTQVTVNQPFDWIIDISNSTTSSNATNIFFEDILDANFTVVGDPTCSVTAGTATCMSGFSVTGNTISGVIPNMESGSTVRIRIPVTAPSFGGAFNNTAEATPDIAENNELTPETNISISNVQVIAPTLTKAFDPDTIFEGQESTLTFTVYNIASNPSQTNISFTDNLPAGVVLSGEAYWVEDNGCTSTFTGTSGDTFVGVTNLTFPEGVASCTFAVSVTSSSIGTHINDSSNFSDQNNIDTSQTYAELTVLQDTTDVDIEILKSVSPEEVSIGEEVIFTITASNLGQTTATLIEVIDNLPSGYEYISSTVSEGVFYASSFTWSIASLTSGQLETLTITARVLSSENLLNIALLSTVNETDRDDTNNSDNAEVAVNNCLEIPQGISPNNDSSNDFLVIPCIEDYPENRIKIFNRLGVQIYQSDNYRNNWDGKPNMGFPETSSLLPVGTYYYILEIPELQKPVIGWLYLNY